MTDQPVPEDRQALAAELALGLLEGQERADALRLCLSDVQFAAEVEAWSHRLSPLLDGIADGLPSDRVWQAIDARTGGRNAAGTIRNLHFWRAGALVAGGIAAALALVMVTRPAVTPQPNAIGVSQLASTAGAVGLAVRYDPRDGLLRLISGALDSGEKSPELWVIASDGVPRSLGLITQGRDAISVDAWLRGYLKAGATLAITLEDATTAPHKAPSSAPILTGTISII